MLLEEFCHGHGQLWIDHMTMEIFELWPWSWSNFFDHFDQKTPTQAKWSKNRGHLIPPKSTMFKIKSNNSHSQIEK